MKVENFFNYQLRQFLNMENCFLPGYNQNTWDILVIFDVLEISNNGTKIKRALQDFPIEFNSISWFYIRSRLFLATLRPMVSFTENSSPIRKAFSQYCNQK